jgi:hypothetical protein
MGNRSSLRRSNHDPVSTAYLSGQGESKKKTHTHENVAVARIVINERRGGWVGQLLPYMYYLPVLRVRDNQEGAQF